MEIVAVKIWMKTNWISTLRRVRVSFTTGKEVGYNVHSHYSRPLKHHTGDEHLCVLLSDALSRRLAALLGAGIALTLSDALLRDSLLYT